MLNNINQIKQPPIISLTLCMWTWADKDSTHPCRVPPAVPEALRRRLFSCWRRWLLSVGTVAMRTASKFKVGGTCQRNVHKKAAEPFIVTRWILGILEIFILLFWHFGDAPVCSPEQTLHLVPSVQSELLSCFCGLVCVHVGISSLIISERDVKRSVTEFCLPHLTSSSHHFSLWFLFIFLQVLRRRHLRRFQADTPQWTGSSGEFRKGHGSSGRWREVKAVYRKREKTGKEEKKK